MKNAILQMDRKSNRSEWRSNGKSEIAM